MLLSFTTPNSKQKEKKKTALKYWNYHKEIAAIQAPKWPELLKYDRVVLQILAAYFLLQRVDTDLI